jgi:hypothetical protein
MKSDTAQLLIVIRNITESLRSSKNWLVLSLHGATTEEDLFWVCETIAGSWITLDKNEGVHNRRDSSKYGMKTSLMVRIRREIDKKNP